MLINERELYREYFLLAEYAAFAKHIVMVDAWQHRISAGAEGKYTQNEGFQFNHRLIRKLAKGTEIDTTVYSFLLGKEVNFTAKIKSMLSQPDLEDLYKGQILWEKWSYYIQSRIDEINDFPQKIKRILLTADLHYCYTEIYDRLTRKIDKKEFERIASFKSDKLEDYPYPVEVINKKPVWTVGQAEIKAGIYGNPKRFFDIYPISFKKKYSLSFVLVEDHCNEEENIFAFESDVSSFYNELKWALYVYKYSLEEIVSVGHYITKRIKHAPDIYHMIGHKYMIEGYLEKAHEYFLKANDMFNTLIPEEFEGRIDDSNEDEYFYNLLYLGYTYFLKGEYENGRSAFQLVNRRTSYYQDFSEVVLLLESKSPSDFINWFHKEYIINPQNEYKNMEKEIRLDMKKSSINYFGKELYTLARKRPFHYIGTICEGLTIYFGTDREKRIEKEKFEQLLEEFKGRTVLIGTSFDNPPTNSLGEWLLKNVSKRALASYIAPILINEGFAMQSDEKMELVFKN